MKQYLASQGEDGNPEGAYLLKPLNDTKYLLQYSRLDSEVIEDTMEYLKQWTFVYNDNLHEQRAIVKVLFYPHFSDFIEFAVELNGIPVSDGQGKDVNVFWSFDDFNANQTFWTDSNGLEMQERIINYRPTWNYSGPENISANYYPVASGIVLRDNYNSK